MDRRAKDWRAVNGRPVNGRAMDWRTMDWRTMDRRTMDRRAMDRRAMDGAMRVAAAHRAALHAALTNLSLQNQAVVHVGERARPAENFDRLGLRQSETAERHNDDSTPDETEPLHGLFPCFAAQTRQAWAPVSPTLIAPAVVCEFRGRVDRRQS